MGRRDRKRRADRGIVQVHRGCAFAPTTRRVWSRCESKAPSFACHLRPGPALHGSLGAVRRRAASVRHRGGVRGVRRGPRERRPVHADMVAPGQWQVEVPAARFADEEVVRGAVSHLARRDGERDHARRVARVLRPRPGKLPRMLRRLRHSVLRLTALGPRGRRAAGHVISTFQALCRTGRRVETTQCAGGLCRKGYAAACGTCVRFLLPLWSVRERSMRRPEWAGWPLPGLRCLPAGAHLRPNRRVRATHFSYFGVAMGSMRQRKRRSPVSRRFVRRQHLRPEIAPWRGLQRTRGPACEDAPFVECLDGKCQLFDPGACR